MTWSPPRLINLPSVTMADIGRTVQHRALGTSGRIVDIAGRGEPVILIQTPVGIYRDQNPMRWWVYVERSDQGLPR